MLDWQEFGRLLRKQRLKAGKGVRELARELMLSPATVSRADRGLPISAEVFLIFCTMVLDIDPRVFLK